MELQKTGKTFLNSLNNSWSLIAVLISLISLSAHFIQNTVLQFSISTFFFSFLLSLVLWNILGSLIQLTPQKGALLLKIIIALTTPLIIAIGLKTYEEFSVFSDQNLMAFALDDPTYLLNVATVFFNSFWVVIIFLIAATAIFILINKKEKALTSKKNNLAKLLLLILIFSIGQNQFRETGYSNLTTLDTSFLFSFKLTKEDTKELTKSMNRKYPQKGEESFYNIVLIVQESMSVEPLSFYGYNNNYTPFFHQWVRQEDTNFVLFKDAMAISGCTDISIPTLYTGVGPEEGYEKLMTLPFMWDYAKTNGYETALISPQRYSWRNMRSFLNNEGLDLMYTSEDTELKTINDLGVDEAAVSLWAKDYILKRNKNKPIFLVYNSNALHRPYQQQSNLIEVPKEIKEPYGKALYILDRSMKNIYDAFAESGELEKTIFIFTSDHGDYTARRIQRLSSFLKETLQIPIMFRFPQKWIEENETKYQQIKSNHASRICNLDLNPTIIELLQSEKPNTTIVKELKGESLFNEIDNTRTITCLSTNETRTWSNDGFGLYKDSLSYIIDSYKQEQLYNLDLDNNQQNNIINATPKESLKKYYEMIENNHYLKTIYKNHVTNDN